MSVKERLKPDKLESEITSYEKSIASKREEIEDIKVFLKAKESDWWPIWKAKKEAKLEYVESNLDNFNKLSERGMATYLCERLILKQDIKMFDEAEERINDLMSEIALSQSKLNELKERLGDYKT